MARIFLLNDTANIPHIGCQAVSDAHARLLGGSGHEIIDRTFLGELSSFSGQDEKECIARVLADEAFRARIEAADTVVVNGEGTLHHGAGSEYFAVLGAAQGLKKITLIVNAVFEAHSGWMSVLKKLDDFCVRELFSLEHAQSLGLKARLVPDSLLGAKFSNQPTMNLNDRIVVTDWHPLRDADVGETLRNILDSVPGSFYYPMLHGINASQWQGSAAAWASAASVITARHHGVYLAAVARKPFVALPSNTKKIEGLIAAAGVKIPICTTIEEIKDGFEYAVNNLSEYQEFFDWLDSHCPLTTFSALGTGSSAADEERELKRLETHLAGKSRALEPSFWGLKNGLSAGLTPLG